MSKSDHTMLIRSVQLKLSHASVTILLSKYNNATVHGADQLKTFISDNEVEQLSWSSYLTEHYMGLFRPCRVGEISWETNLDKSEES